MWHKKQKLHSTLYLPCPVKTTVRIISFFPHWPGMTGVWKAHWTEPRLHESCGRGSAVAPDTYQHPAVPSYCSLLPPWASGRTGCPLGWTGSSARRSARQCRKSNYFSHLKWRGNKTSKSLKTLKVHFTTICRSLYFISHKAAWHD